MKDGTEVEVTVQDGPAQRGFDMLNDKKYASFKQEIEIEHRRLISLQSYHILDCLPDPAYARFTAMAARFLRAQVARIVLVDLDRCWTVASSVEKDGAPREIPRKNTVYEWSINRAREVSLIHDINQFPSKSKREDANLRKTLYDHDINIESVQETSTGFDTSNLSHKKASSKNMRFFVGAPLVTNEGHVLGTLAVLDENPRTAVSVVEQQVLLDLAKSIMDLMEERRRQLFNGVNGASFQPGLLRSARFITSKLEVLRYDKELQSMARHHQNDVLESALLSAKYLSMSLTSGTNRNQSLW
ncbi:hypothetical protein ACA910_006971 [Epithemia clementina (nom. ined.)]